MQTAVKIGLLLRGESVPFWLSEAIANLRDAEYAEFPLIVKQQGTADQPSAGNNCVQENVCPLSASTPNSGFKYAGFRRYQTIDAGLKRRQPAYNSAVALRQLLPDCEIIEYRFEAPSTDNHNISQQAVIKKIEELSIDFLLETGSALKDSVLIRHTPLGCWQFCNGNGAPFSEQPSGFWELTTGAAEISIALQMQSVSNDEYQTQRISVSRHLPDILLLGRQRQNVMMQTASQLVTAVRRLHRQGPEGFTKQITSEHHTAAGKQPHYPYPDNWQLFKRLLAHALRYGKLKIRKQLFFEQWSLLLHHNVKQGNPIHPDPRKFQIITPPDDRIWADPFVVADENDPDKFYIFVEEMEYLVGHGHISVLTVDHKGNHSGAVPVIKQPYHMSYPFIFEYGNEKFMIPETAESRTIQLYRCVNFPHQWVFVKTLMEDVFAVDTTLHEIEGRWWMFTTLREAEHTDCLDQLHLFHANSPLSEAWQPHLNNPVVRDVRAARQAGACFEHEGKLYRPSQDGGYHYGWGIKINEISRLDEENYVEQEVNAIEPGWRWSVIATHTLNRLNGMVVSDARILRPRLLRWIRNRFDQTG